MRAFPLALLLAAACRGAAAPDVYARADEKAAVIVFITVDCPIANQSIPELNRIYRDYRARGVRMTLVHVDPEVTAETAARHAKEYEVKPPYLLDPGQEWVRSTKAEVTPEAVVFDRSGEIVYQGRINDRFPAFGDARQEVKQHDLRESLDALLAGRPVPRARTKAVGCFIPDPLPTR